MYGKKFVGAGWSDQLNSSQSERRWVVAVQERLARSEAVGASRCVCFPVHQHEKASPVPVYIGTVSIGQRPCSYFLSRYRFVLKRAHGGNWIEYWFYFNAPHFLQAPWCCSRNHLFFRGSHAFCPCGQSSRCHVQACSRGWYQCLACPRSVGGRIKLDSRDSLTAGTGLPRARRSKSALIVSR